MAHNNLLVDRMLDAEAKAARWLADGNEAAERGAIALAERLYERAQKWHDKAMILREKIEL